MMTGLATEGMSMLWVTHEMEFVREVADLVVLMGGSEIIEEESPTRFFEDPKHEGRKGFLGQLIY